MIVDLILDEDTEPIVKKEHQCTSVSQDERYIKTKNDIKIDKMCSTIKQITQQLLPTSKDVSFAVHRLSHQALAQFQNQTHSPNTTKAAMKKLQKVLDETRDNIIGLDLCEPDTYANRDDPRSVLSKLSLVLLYVFF